LRDEDVFRLRRQIRALNHRLQQEQPAVEGLSPTMLRILVTAERAASPLRPSELGAELRIKDSNVASSLRALEVLDLVVLRADPADGRKAFVHLTDRAARFVASVRQSYNAWFREAIGSLLTQQEQRVLEQAGEIMQRLADHEARAAQSSAANGWKISLPPLDGPDPDSLRKSKDADDGLPSA
jgi:DNA-binding MarR family transcriptional regulator